MFDDILNGAIERWIKERLGQSVGPVPLLSDAAQVAFMAFEDWAKAAQFEPIAAELMVYDPYLGFAGTLDWIAKINGILSVGDWKTGKAIYGEALLQNAAYVAALRKQCRLGDEPMQGCIVRFPKELADVKREAEWVESPQSKADAESASRRSPRFRCCK